MKVKQNIISFLLGIAFTVTIGAVSTFEFTLSSDTLYVDGVRSDKSIYKYEGSNHPNLRDTAEMLGADVAYNDGRIDITSKLTDIEAVAANYKNSCVMVYVKKNGADVARGSGFFYDGMIFTAKHLLDYGDTYVIYTDNKRSFIATERIDFDTDYDIAAIKTDYNSTSVKLGDSDELIEGEKLLSIASYEGWVNILDECLLGGKAEYYSSFHLQIHESIMIEGSSGGAVFNTKGELVGVIVSGKKSVELCMAVPSNELKKLITP